jgi:uncharacterized membrane protein YraQ (UPF0718 family)
MGRFSGGFALLCVVAALAAQSPEVSAHPSCCTKHLLPLIPDASEAPPDEYGGEPRMIPDPRPDNVKPDYWDDDDDGEWEPDEIVNPAFRWKPRLIPNPNYKPPEFSERLQTEIEKAVPWVVLGVLITAVLDAAQLSASSLKGYLQNTGPVGGALIGLATPLCSCGSLPVAAGFVSGGVSLRVVVAFLTATQSAGLDSAAITWGLLGPEAAMCRLGGAVVLSVAAGYAVPASEDSSAATKHGGGDGDGGGGARGLAAVLVTLVTSAVSTAQDVFPSVIFGLCLSTAAVHHIPHLATLYQSLRASGVTGEAAAAAAAGGEAVISEAASDLAIRLAVLGSAAPLQLCEHSTVAYAAAIQKAGGAPGLAFAFLLVRPAGCCRLPRSPIVFCLSAV